MENSSTPPPPPFVQSPTPSHNVQDDDDIDDSSPITPRCNSNSNKPHLQPIPEQRNADANSPLLPTTAAGPALKAMINVQQLVGDLENPIRGLDQQHQGTTPATTVAHRAAAACPTHSGFPPHFDTHLQVLTATSTGASYYCTSTSSNNSSPASTQRHDDEGVNDNHPRDDGLTSPTFTATSSHATPRLAPSQQKQQQHQDEEEAEGGPPPPMSLSPCVSVLINDQVQQQQQQEGTETANNNNNVKQFVPAPPRGNCINNSGRGGAASPNTLTLSINSRRQSSIRSAVSFSETAPSSSLPSQHVSFRAKNSNIHNNNNDSDFFEHSTNSSTSTIAANMSLMVHGIPELIHMSVKEAISEQLSNADQQRAREAQDKLRDMMCFCARQLSDCESVARHLIFELQGSEIGVIDREFRNSDNNIVCLALRHTYERKKEQRVVGRDAYVVVELVVGETAGHGMFYSSTDVLQQRGSHPDLAESGCALDFCASSRCNSNNLTLHQQAAAATATISPSTSSSDGSNNSSRGGSSGNNSSGTMTSNNSPSNHMQPCLNDTADLRLFSAFTAAAAAARQQHQLPSSGGTGTTTAASSPSVMYSGAGSQLASPPVDDVVSPSA